LEGESETEKTGRRDWEKSGRRGTQSEKTRQLRDITGSEEKGESKKKQSPGNTRDTTAHHPRKEGKGAQRKSASNGIKTIVYPRAGEKGITIGGGVVVAEEEKKGALRRWNKGGKNKYHIL